MTDEAISDHSVHSVNLIVKMTVHPWRIAMLFNLGVRGALVAGIYPPDGAWRDIERGEIARLGIRRRIRTWFRRLARPRTAGLA